MTADGPEVILFFGHLREYKGVDVLIRAFAKVRERRAGAVLVIAGKEQPGLLDRYRRLIDEEGIAGSVILRGGYVKEAEMAGLFRQADLVAFPYRESDGSGAVQLAYSFGKPVVASGVGVMPEIVEDGINGYLTPPDDPGALADAIVRFFELPAFESDKMGRMSKLFAERMYGWDMIADMTREFYLGAGRVLEREEA
jgi:D-inositol-3-phosphate glycosyltransferase